MLLPIGILLVLTLIVITLIAEGVGGRLQERGVVTNSPREPNDFNKAGGPEKTPPSMEESTPTTQILFGDLHVHTTYSADAFVFSLPLFQGEGAHPPADACDFARFCSALDFWSINDHAESITPRQWSETRQSIRECNAVTDPKNPDTVAFLGWEWTQSAPLDTNDDSTHYGHKNVILLTTEEGQVPTRPIGAGAGGLFEQPIPSAAWALLRFGMTIRDFDQLGPYLDFNRFAREARGLDRCPEGIPVRDLPEDCLEGAETPEVLFRKLEEWGTPSLVIPHGTSWGIHAPARAKLSQQLSKPQHDPQRQRLFEVYSGHGSSEVFRDWRDFNFDAQGIRRCAPPQNGYLPCCWRAGELIQARCEADLPVAECETRVEETRQLAMNAGSPYSVVAGTVPDDWLECGQLPDSFLPAYEYRPNMSAQYGLSLVGEDGSTYRYGLIASSDNHTARGGSGYKEIPRSPASDAYGFRSDWVESFGLDQPPHTQPLASTGDLAGAALALERGASFYYTGGLVAVLANSRERESIWEALEARRVYGTSGDRILLWFDLLNAPNGPLPMGSEAEIDRAPKFEVRAVGAYEQLPGCPKLVQERLSPDRLEKLCLGECYHPGERRHKIDRIEVVRIRKQLKPDEPVANLIEDPWRSFECPPSEEGCRIVFEDPDPDHKRETVYYVRALQEPTPTVGGSPVRCERDADGDCTRARGCPVSGPRFDAEDSCLSEANERAWSSPIFVRMRK